MLEIDDEIDDLTCNDLKKSKKIKTSSTTTNTNNITFERYINPCCSNDASICLICDNEPNIINNDRQNISSEG